MFRSRFAAALGAAIVLLLGTGAALAMQIFVDLPGKTITLDVDNNEQIETLRQMIEDSERIPVDQQQLFFGDRELFDGRGLADYRIEEDATLQLVLRAPPVDAVVGLKAFLESRGSQILAHLPDADSRLARLRQPSEAAPLFGYLAEPALGGAVPAIDAITRDGEPTLLPWSQLGLGSLATGDTRGGIATVAAGLDYRLDDNLLLGSFILLDRFSQRGPADATADGLGWIAGATVTGRVGEVVYFDLLGGAGVSSNRISPTGDFEDEVGGSRWLLDATVGAEWNTDAWSIAPRLRAAYIEERTEAYLDGGGADIAAQAVGIGRLAAGSDFRHALGEGGSVGLSLDAVAEHRDGALGAVRGRIGAELRLLAPGGAALDLSVAHEGIGADHYESLSGRFGLSAPIR